MSLHKFFHKSADPQGQPLSWGRAEADGAPFRGEVPLYKDEEYERKVVRSHDARCEFFDVSDPRQRLAYLDVVDAVMSGWFQCLCIERFWQGTTKHYVEWLEFYYEDGSRAANPYAALLPQGVHNGNGHGRSTTLSR